MHKAVFLDRDGVLNKEIGEYVPKEELFEVPEHVPDQLKRLQDEGFLLVVITNQGGIAKGLYDHKDLEKMHQKMRNTLKQNDVELTDIYYCPHHPDYTKCLCRKPGSLMIEKAMAKYGIEADKSFMIGDRDRDVEAATGAGVRGFLIEPNQNWSFVVDEILK